jgi:hypothetical protein
MMLSIMGVKRIEEMTENDIAAILDGLFSNVLWNNPDEASDVSFLFDC